jgi:hypothetical protein
MESWGKVILFVVFVLYGANLVAAEEPQISADLGPCWADFTVTDAAKKPVYLAKIHTLIRYGFLSKRKTELELQTDVNGKGRFIGLPQEVKKPIEFEITYKDQSKTVRHDPAVNCHAPIAVELESK